MGNSISYWYWGGDPDERNEISGMSPRDIYHVRASWNPIYANAQVSGLLIFTRLFDADPETQTFFKYIAKASKEEMATNIIFRAHIINIMSAFNSAIQHLNNPDVVTVMMHKLGTFHKNIAIKKKHFMVLKDVLVSILMNDLKCSQNVITSWGRFIDFIYQHIFMTLDG